MIAGSSRVTVLRAGQVTVRQSGAITPTGTIHTLGEKLSTDGLKTGRRVALNLLGDGYVELLPDNELQQLAADQVKQSDGIIRGQLVEVSLPGERGKKALGRFGWKDQHATLLSASGEALLSELGVSNALFPVPDRESSAEKPALERHEVDSMVAFLRSTEPIAPDQERAATGAAHAGAILFRRIGCAICHVETLRTASAGSKLAAGTITVPKRMADRDIHPYSDFLLHDVGTGDGLVQNIAPADYDQRTADKFRTAPLWGVRFRSWMMHDGQSVTYHQAIMRHAGEASHVVTRYQELTPIEKEQLRSFLDSL